MSTSNDYLVAKMNLRDVIEDVRLLLDGGTADVDGITAAADPHPAFDPAGATEGEGAMIVTFSYTAGRRRVAELEMTARWREDSCWHPEVRNGAAGPECVICGSSTEETQR